MTQDLRERVARAVSANAHLPAFRCRQVADAALTVALEEAARVAERRGRQMEKIGTTPGKQRHLEWMVSAYMDAAATIRALIPKAP